MNQINRIIKHIKKAPKIALFHHINPDGDSLSCSYGLLLALKQKYPKKEIVLVGDKKSFKTSFPFLDINYRYFKSKIDNSYLAIIGDTSVSERIACFKEFVKAKYKICFDHHQNKHNVAYDVFWQASLYPASTMQAIEIIKKMKINLNENISFFLLIGLLTDTGNFVFSLANPIPPLYYSQLLQKVSDEKMNNFFNSFRQRTMQDVELQKEFLNAIKFSGKVAYVVFDKQKVMRYPNVDYKRLVNLIGNIEKYPIWALFIYNQELDGQETWKLHFRSNGPKVSDVAIKLGGGGHYRAAGAKVPSSITVDDIVQKLNKL